MSGPPRELPPQPSLEQLRKQAKDLLHLQRTRDPAATLAAAQFALAREYGFASWPKLKRHVELIRRPADFYEPTWGRDTWRFFTAVFEGRETTVRQMLDADPTLARAEYAYLQALHYAVKGGRLGMVELLLEARANPLAEGWSGRPLGDDTPLARARDREQTDIVRLLEAAAAKPLAPMPERKEAPPDALGLLEKEMSGYGHNGDMRGARDMLRRHPGLAYAGLYEAVHHGHNEVARFLLENGADPTKPWRWACWFTPLMHSLRYPKPNYEMAALLMEHGITADDANGMGMTTLHILVGLGTVAAAEWLLDRGADINRRDHEFDSTALAWAARCGREDMVKLLRSRGAQPMLPDDEPWATPAAWARRRGHTQIFKLL